MVLSTLASSDFDLDLTLCCSSASTLSIPRFSPRLIMVIGVGTAPAGSLSRVVVVIIIVVIAFSSPPSATPSIRCFFFPSSSFSSFSSRLFISLMMSSGTPI